MSCPYSGSIQLINFFFNYIRWQAVPSQKVSDRVSLPPKNNSQYRFHLICSSYYHSMSCRVCPHQFFHVSPVLRFKAFVIIFATVFSAILNMHRKNMYSKQIEWRKTIKITFLNYVKPALTFS